MTLKTNTRLYADLEKYFPESFAKLTPKEKKYIESKQDHFGICRGATCDRDCVGRAKCDYMRISPENRRSIKGILAERKRKYEIIEKVTGLSRTEFDAYVLSKNQKKGDEVEIHLII